MMVLHPFFSLTSLPFFLPPSLLHPSPVLQGKLYHSTRMPGEDVINVLNPDTLGLEGAVQLDCERRGWEGRVGKEGRGRKRVKEMVL